MSDEPEVPVFGHACPQHPDRGIEAVTCEAVGGGFLVTARYQCGHRHTCFAAVRPGWARDTRGVRYTVGC
jgi:hypothetical protein